MTDQMDFFRGHSHREQFDLHRARGERDRGVATVTRHAQLWTKTARDLLPMVIPPGWTGRPEEIRMALLDADLPHPHHPNCWGALLLWCVKTGFLVDTGEMEQPKDPRSHARKTHVYSRPCS